MKTKNKPFEVLVKEEMLRARKSHKSIYSIHEGFAILLEEVDEVWDEVKKKTKERNLKNLLKELVQISAMTQRMAEDVVIPLLKKD